MIQLRSVSFFREGFYEVNFFISMFKICQFEIIIPEEESESRILISDNKEFCENVVTHIGLSITIELLAHNIDEGLQTARVRANYVAVILSFITNATISDPISVLGYETTEFAK